MFSLFNFENPANLLLPLGVGLLLLSVLMGIRKRKSASQARRDLPMSPAEHIERAKQGRGMRGDLEKLMVEIEQLARQMSSQIDAKMTHLEKLVQEADDRIARLEQLQANQASQETEGQAVEGDWSETQTLAEPWQEPSDEYEDQPEPPADMPMSHTFSLAEASSPHSTEEPPSEPEFSSPSFEVNPERDALAKQVYALADSGATPESIAETLDEHVGKVELILALREAS